LFGFFSVKYIRKPIDYSILDDVGHGVRLAQPQQQVQMRQLKLIIFDFASSKLCKF
jgi:hypothetical protein